MGPRPQSFVAIANMLLLLCFFCEHERWAFEGYDQCCKYGKCSANPLLVKVLVAWCAYLRVECEVRPHLATHQLFVGDA
jgi:hypothetical protein